MAGIRYLTDANRISKSCCMGMYPPQDSYGDKLTTPYSVQINGTHWRQVWAICHSNVASFYVIWKGERLYLHDQEVEDIRDNRKAGVVSHA